MRIRTLLAGLATLALAVSAPAAGAKTHHYPCGKHKPRHTNCGKHKGHHKTNPGQHKGQRK